MFRFLSMQSYFLRSEKLFWCFRFLKGNKFSPGVFFVVFRAWARVAGFHFLKYEKSFLFRKHKKNLSLRIFSLTLDLQMFCRTIYNVYFRLYSFLLESHAFRNLLSFKLNIFKSDWSRFANKNLHF